MEILPRPSLDLSMVMWMGASVQASCPGILLILALFLERAPIDEGGYILTTISVLQSVRNEFWVDCVGLVIYLPIRCEGQDEAELGIRLVWIQTPNLTSSLIWAS